MVVIMKKILSLLILTISIIVLCACSSNDDKKSSSEYKIALVTDYDDVDDHSFNQTTYEACVDFSNDHKMEFNYFKPEEDSKEQREAMIVKAVEEGYNIIVLPGFAFADSIADLAPNYENVKFIALDISKASLMDSVNLSDRLDDKQKSEFVAFDNVYCASFKEEISGFLAGYSAVSLGYTDLGFVGGMKIPAVQRYGYGFLQGCDYAAKLSDQEVNIRFGYANSFTGSAELTKATKKWYQNGCEVIFACGGKLFTSVAEAASELDKKMIGVDVDQSQTVDTYYKEGIVLTSAMKGLYPATYNTLDKIVNLNQWNMIAGKYDSLGLVSSNPTINYCQIPMETTEFDSNYTEEDYKNLVNSLFLGEIEISDKVDELPQTTNTKLMYWWDVCEINN